MRADIKQLKKEFDKLRQVNGGRLLNVPERLQRLTVKFLENSSWSEVVTYLEISNSTLSRWRRLYLVDEALKKDKAGKSRRSGQSRQSCLVEKCQPGPAPHEAFVEIDSSIVSAAVQMARPQKDMSDKDSAKVDVELQTRFGSVMRISGPLDASVVYQLAKIVCNNEGGYR